LEEKRATLDSEYQDIFQEHSQLKQEEKALKREVKLLQQDLERIRQDHFQLQNLNNKQQMEKINLHYQVNNMEMALNLEAEIEQQLSKALKGADEMMQLSSQV
jgi:hypothetical protein